MAQLRIAIIGGGISGLALAYRILSLMPQAQIKVFEASSAWGGAIQTRRQEGFILEGGPDSLITDKPAGIELCQAIGLEEELLGANTDDRRAMVVHQGRLQPIPEGFRLLAPTRLWPFILTPIISPLGKLRIGLDLLLPRRSAAKGIEDETLAGFVGRRLGREVLDKLAQPLIGGIYGADPERLSLAATMPRFLKLEQQNRSVIWGLLKGMKRNRAALQARPSWEKTRPGKGGVSGARYSMFVSLKNGLQSIIERLLTFLPASSLSLNTTVSRIAPIEQGGWAVTSFTANGSAATQYSTEEFDCVALCTPAWQASSLVSFEPKLERLLSSIRYSSSAVVNLVFKKEQILSGLNSFGFVVPRLEERVLLACTYASVKYADRAPSGYVVLRCFCGGANREKEAQLEPQKLVALIMQDLRDLVGIRGEPCQVWTVQHHKVMPQYEYGHMQLLEELKQALAAYPGLYVLGNGLTGVGVPDCSRQALETAKKIKDQYQQL